MTGTIVAALTSDGYKVRQVVAGEMVRRLSADRYEADLSSPEALRQLHGLIAGPDGIRVGTIINFLGLCRTDCEEMEDSVTIAERTFQLVKEFAEELRSSGGWFVNITGLDGQFGLSEGAENNLPTGRAAAVAGAEAGRLRQENCQDAGPASDAPVVGRPGHRREGAGVLNRDNWRGSAPATAIPTSGRLFSDGCLSEGVAAAGTLGISKTLQREYAGLHVKAIDVDPSIQSDLLAARLLQELTIEDELLEVGLTRQGRWQLALKQEPVPHGLPPLGLDAESVVLITGGANGVTAEVAETLAAAMRSRLILVGRSPLPEPETPRTRGLDQTALRELLLAEARRTQAGVQPAQIERRVQRILKDRQILAHLDACRAAGATVEYHSLDVRDAQQFGRLIDDLYERFGRIDGVVHGAGVVEDKRIADKTAASFAKVFRTKVDGAWTLARKLRPQSLKFLVFFGSVSGRFGNAGQVDYSAANEVLNKLADQLARRWPARVVCINWGPWDAGMVGDDLRRLYASRGIELIPVAEGVRAFLDEVRLPGGSSSCAEVIISGSVERMARTGRKRPSSQEAEVSA